MKPLLLCVALIAVSRCASAQCSSPGNDAQKIVCRATDNLRDLLTAADRGIPQQLLSDSACVIVVPDLKKGGFIVGLEYGRGLFSCRKPNGVGWTSPGFVKIVGGKFGLLIGGAEADIVMLVRTQDGMRHLLQDKTQLGGEASAAAGPIGRNLSAMTDAALHAAILTYSRQRGIFGGLDLSGAAVVQDEGLIAQLYGQRLTNKEIISTGMAAPEAALPFLRTLSKFSSRR